MYQVFEPKIVRTRDFLDFGDEVNQKKSDLGILQTQSWQVNWLRRKVCMNDGAEFTGPTYCIPLEYDELKDEYSVIFSFCSLSCAKRKMISSRFFKPENCLGVFATMALKVYGVSRVVPAPPIEMLNRYLGGNQGYTLEQYRSMATVCNVSLTRTPFRMAPIDHFTLSQRPSSCENPTDSQFPISSESEQKKLFQMSPRTAQAKKKTNPFSEEEHLLSLSHHPNIKKNLFHIKEELKTHQS